jgi:hypothetical protein
VLSPATVASASPRRRKITALLPLVLKPLTTAQRFGVEKRAVTALLLLVVSFAATWLPHAVAVLAYHAGACGLSDRCRAVLAAKITSVFFYVGSLNSFLNPFIYTWGFKELREYLVNFIKCKGVVVRYKPSWRVRSKESGRAGASATPGGRRVGVCVAPVFNNSDGDPLDKDGIARVHESDRLMSA